MIDLQNPNAYKLVTVIALFNLVLLAIDILLVYVSSRQVEALYTLYGLGAIYNVGVYFFKLRAVIIIIGSLVAVFKFWEVKGQRVGTLDKWILRIAFILLIIGSIAALETFIETFLRILTNIKFVNVQ